MRRLVNLVSLAIILPQCLGALSPPLFERVPVGSIKPTGWALGQAHVQANGLAGHIREFGSYVKGSIWVEGGSIEYSEMHEAAPYWFNAQVALAFQLDDDRLKAQVRDFLDWTLDHQQEDGWIGPEQLNPNSTVPRLTWPRYLVLLGFVQYAEADTSQTERIVNAIHRFVPLVHSIWKAGKQGDPSLGEEFGYQFVRWEEMVYVLQWLYDNHPRGQEDMLIETMQLLRDAGFSWKGWFQNGVFPTEAVTAFNHSTHGVNTGEALKSEALAFRFTGDETDRQNTFDRIDMLYKFHGRASGTYSADEHLAGLNPSRGTELDDIVEQIFSFATVYGIFGNNSVADRTEKLAYNALPAGIMPDWWSHQYDQQVNQIWSQLMDPPPWGNNGPTSNIFGFEPNYPCCTVNHPAAYPKFWAHSFFIDKSDSSLLHVFLGPSQWKGTVGNNDVSVSVDTLYPFGNTLTYQITASKAFPFKIRVPEWSQTGNSTITVNDGKAAELHAENEHGLHMIQVPKGTTKVHVNLDAPVVIEPRFNGAIAVTRGALNFALELSNNITTSPGIRSAQALANVRRLFPDAPPEFLTPVDNNTVDNVILPTSEWRLAIDPSTLTLVDQSATTTSLPEQVWAPGAQPVWFTAQACQIEWGLEKNTAAPPPQSPVACATDERLEVKLVPFGAAKLRLGEIPVMQV
ncbi:hypothetical protein L218DRAFT_928652 [Marasmius fiardii PR-910]|nr:hypothetical protein L218DRAFT_928652 [Marasmius fiardii PR-910]